MLKQDYLLSYFEAPAVDRSSLVTSVEMAGMVVIRMSVHSLCSLCEKA
jgi:hypothetical protein